MQAWDGVAGALRLHGCEATVTTYAAPVQMEGRLPSGELFYFRARRNTCSLAVGGVDPADVPAWRAEVELPGDFTATWLEADEGKRIFAELVERYRREGPPALT